MMRKVSRTVNLTSQSQCTYAGALNMHQPWATISTTHCGRDKDSCSNRQNEAVHFIKVILYLVPIIPLDLIFFCNADLEF